MTPRWRVAVWPRVQNFKTVPVPVTPMTMIPRCNPYPCHTLWSLINLHQLQPQQRQQQHQCTNNNIDEPQWLQQVTTTSTTMMMMAAWCLKCIVFFLFFSFFTLIITYLPLDYSIKWPPPHTSNTDQPSSHCKGSNDHHNPDSPSCSPTRPKSPDRADTLKRQWQRQWDHMMEIVWNVL